MSSQNIAGKAESTLSFPDHPDFRVLFEASPCLLLVLTPEFNIAAVSDAYLQATKTKREEILGRAIFDVFPDNPNDAAATGVRNLSASLNRVLNGRDSDAMAIQKYDIRRPQSEGGGFEERYWSPINFPVLDANGKVAYIIHRVEDVTEIVRLKLRKAEQEQFANELSVRGSELEAEILLRKDEIIQRQRIEAELRRAEERMRSIVDHVIDGIISIDEKGRIESFNASAERIFGYVASEVIGKNVNLLMPEPFHSEHDGYIANYLRTGEAKIIGIGREVVGLRKDGSTFPMDLAVSVFHLENRWHFTGMVRDITTRKSLEAQFLQSQKMEVVGHLAGGVAHDFNNLLAVILGCCHFLESDVALSDDSQSLVHEIYKASNRAAGLTRQLLAFSRKQILQPKVVNLNDIVMEAVTMLDRLIGENITLETSLPATLWPVKVDSGQMDQVIMNLAVNARDAMTNGGTLTIETANVVLDESSVKALSDVKPGPYVVLTVADTGCGMDQSTLAHMFEPFFTTKTMGQGTGLGLATVFGIVKQSNGHISVQSEVGQGTVFKVYLPTDQTMADPHTVPAIPTDLPRGTETVLVVEDEELLRSLTCRILNSQGYEILEAGNGEEALRVCVNYQQAIHLVLTDVVMPQMSGQELYERLRVGHPGLKVLFMSGYTDDNMIRHGVLKAQTNFIQKPFTYATLANAVRDILDRDVPVE